MTSNIINLGALSPEPKAGSPFAFGSSGLNLNVRPQQEHSLTLDWKRLLVELEDVVFPQKSLDVWERMPYLHLLTQTHGRGKDSQMFSIASLAQKLPMSDFKVREVIRSLHAKAVLIIHDRSRFGHEVKVLLPSQIDGLVEITATKPPLDIELLNFFDRRYLDTLLRRENSQCFYCFRKIDKTTCELDHVVAQAEELNNGYRNVVCACHNCNKSKGAQAADAFFRSKYRAGVLDEHELEERLQALVALQTGRLVPVVEEA